MGARSKPKDDELASDSLERARVSESTAPYLAQAAVKRKVNSNKGEKSEPDKGMGAKSKPKKHIFVFSMLKPRKIAEFSVKRFYESSVFVMGVLGLTDKVIIVDQTNNKLKMYDSTGHYLSSTDLKERTLGITRVGNHKFATCGGYKVFLWRVRGQKKFWTVGGQQIISEDEAYDVDNKVYGIHYNDTYYCVLHRLDNAVTILDRQGRQVRKIVIKEAFGKKIRFGFDIHMDWDTHDIYVPCWLSGVLCMSVEGEALWFLPMPNAYLRGITEIQGAIIVADSNEHKLCLHLISKTGQHKGKLLDTDKLAVEPTYISYYEQEQKLYLSYYRDTEKRNIISVYSV